MPFSLSIDAASLLLAWATAQASPTQPSSLVVRLMAVNGSKSSPGVELSGASYSAKPITFASAAVVADVAVASNDTTITWTSLDPTSKTVAGMELWDSALNLRIAWYEQAPAVVPGGTGLTYDIGDITLSMLNNFTSGQGADDPIGFDKNFRLKMLNWLTGKTVTQPVGPLQVVIGEDQDVSWETAITQHSGDLWEEQDIAFGTPAFDGANAVTANSAAVPFDGLDATNAMEIGAFELWDSDAVPTRIFVINTQGHPNATPRTIQAGVPWQIPAQQFKLKIT